MQRHTRTPLPRAASSQAAQRMVASRSTGQDGELAKALAPAGECSCAQVPGPRASSENGRPHVRLALPRSSLTASRNMIAMHLRAAGPASPPRLPASRASIVVAHLWTRVLVLLYVRRWSPQQVGRAVTHVSTDTGARRFLGCSPVQRQPIRHPLYRQRAVHFAAPEARS